MSLLWRCFFFVFLYVWNSLVGGSLFSPSVHLSPALQWMGQAATGPLCSAAVPLPAERSVRALNAAAPKNTTADFISANGFGRWGTQPAKKRQHFLPLHKLVGAETLGGRRNDSDYCHTVLKSYFCCSDWRAAVPSRCVRLCLCFMGDRGCVCRELRADQAASFFSFLFFFFQLVTPEGGAGGLQRSWVDRTLTHEREEVIFSKKKKG